MTFLAIRLLAALSSPQVVTASGDTLYAPPLPDSTRTRYEARLEEARRDWELRPRDPSAIVWLGRRTAYLGRFQEAVEIFTRGIAEHPAEPRLYRHRGHRYITLQRFDLAISDLERAARLTGGQPDEVEPDGLPNARGIPTSTLQSNIWYHLGLAHYLRGDFPAALRAYRQSLRRSKNPDMLCATSHWLYMTLRRLGRAREARAVLAPIRADLDVIENRGYFRLLRMYRGELPVDSLLASGDGATVEDATLGYGVANWHLDHGRAAEGERILRRVAAGPQWPAFGHIAARVELERIARSR